MASSAAEMMLQLSCAKSKDTQMGIYFNSTDDNSVAVRACVTPPTTGKRTPIDVCCIVDVSGSMEVCTGVL